MVETDLDGLINLLTNLKTALREAVTPSVRKIGDNVKRLRSDPTVEPKEAEEELDITLESEDEYKPNIFDHDIEQEYYTEDGTNLDKLFNPKVSASSVELQEVIVPRENLTVPKGNGLYKWIKSQHIVFYELAHIAGFNYYVGRRNNIKLKDFIHGRDIIFSAIALSVPDIRKIIINKLVEKL